MATTVTVPPGTLPYLNSGSAFIGLNGRYAAWINVDPGGGADSVGYAATNVGTGPFRLAPRVGDRLAISIYYDQRGHDFFTVTDLTRPATQTVMLYVGQLIYSAAGLSRSRPTGSCQSARRPPTRGCGSSPVAA